MRKSFYYLALAGLLIASRANSKTWTIDFGGNNGSPAFGYSPQAISVNVGDTIVWQGTFANHPLTLVSAPSGAQTFSGHNTGTSFAYPVTVAGNYGYRCDFHWQSLGMVGGFAAAAAGVEVNNPTLQSMSQNYPNPVDLNQTHETMIHVMLDKPQHVRLQLFDMKGQLVATQVDEQFNEGMHMITVDVSHLSSGTYNYVLTQGDAVERRAMIVVK